MIFVDFCRIKAWPTVLLNIEYLIFIASCLHNAFLNELKIMAKNTIFNFAWREQNNFELLVDGSNFFPVMLAAIRSSKQFVLLEMYLFNSGKVADSFIEVLIEAANRGVIVYVLLDDFGAMGFLKKDRTRLIEAGIHLSFYNPLRYGDLRRNLFRNHRKLLVSDYHIAFVGGAGITVVAK